MKRSVLLLAAGLAACKGRTSPAQQVASGAAPAAAVPAPPVVTPRPALPAIDAPPPELHTPGDRFAAEEVDYGWKDREESELRRRLAHLPGGPPALECRRATCLVTITASEPQMRTAIDQLDQLRDIAQHVVLTAPAKQPDGKLALRAYLRFDR